MPHEVVGSQMYTASEVVERALRAIGAFPMSDSEPSAEDMQEALWWLDMVIADEAGSGPRLWLIRDELELTLEDAVASYDLNALLNSQIKEGVQFPTAAMYQDANGNRRPIRIIPQKKFREITKPDTPGPPVCVFIDRLNGPLLWPYPVPSANEDGAKIILTVQTFADSVKPKAVTGNSALGNETINLRPAWNLFLVNQLAAFIGNGPVRALPLQRIQSFQAQAARLHDRLETFENRQHDDEPPFVAASIYM